MCFLKERFQALDFTLPNSLTAHVVIAKCNSECNSEFSTPNLKD